MSLRLAGWVALVACSMSAQAGYENDYNYLHVQVDNGRAEISCRRIFGQYQTSGETAGVRIDRPGMAVQFATDRSADQIRADIMTKRSARSDTFCPERGPMTRSMDRGAVLDQLSFYCRAVSTGPSGGVGRDCGGLRIQNDASAAPSIYVPIRSGQCNFNEGGNALRELQEATSGTSRDQLEGFCRNAVQAGVRISSPAALTQRVSHRVASPGSSVAVANSARPRPSRVPRAESRYQRSPLVRPATLAQDPATGGFTFESCVTIANAVRDRAHALATQGSCTDALARDVNTERRQFYENLSASTCRQFTDDFRRTRSWNSISLGQIHRASRTTNALDLAYAQAVYELRQVACRCTRASSPSAEQPSARWGGAFSSASHGRGCGRNYESNWRGSAGHGGGASHSSGAPSQGAAPEAVPAAAVTPLEEAPASLPGSP